MKYFLALSLVLLFKISFATDILDEISQAFKTGNTKEISKYFSSSVDFSILNIDFSFSNDQAEQVLKNFFEKHPPKGSKVIHKVVSNANYKFGVIILSTTNGNFRTSYELKNAAGKFLITQIKIEESKD